MLLLNGSVWFKVLEVYIMASLSEIISYTNQYLNTGRFKDYCPNGLQIEGKEDVQTIVSGVSASIELFQRAHEREADLILVHHGILWSNQSLVISGSFKKRIKYLLTHEISLLAYHLPLDAHEGVGNNAVVAKRLGLKDLEGFANYKGNEIGYIGHLDEAISYKDFADRVESVFQNQLASYPFGKKKIQRVGIVTGGAEELIMSAVEKNCDLYITGEVGEPTLHLAKEEEINFIAAGHYNTEKFGVQALGEQIAREMKVKHLFIDVPNAV